MSEPDVPSGHGHHWYLRPVLFVSDLSAALAFYIETLGFVKRWHSADGTGTVCQVDRGGCEIILCEEPARGDKARLFIELNREGIDELRREMSERSIPAQAAWWGYDVIQIIDPDGNELLFPLDETNDRQRQADTA
jgi:catechol 2,3-dioxygenase-like lactoylglutathione lyase family enzyme